MTDEQFKQLMEKLDKIEQGMKDRTWWPQPVQPNPLQPLPPNYAPVYWWHDVRD